MQKRGQTTIFIILGIVLLAVIAIFYFIGGKISLINIQPEEFPDVESYIQGCLDDVVKVGQGIAVKSDNFKSSLEDYVKTNLPLKCNDFSRFTNYNIEVGELTNVESTLRPNKDLVVEVTWPIKILKNGKITSLNNFISKDVLLINFCFPIIVDNYDNCISQESKTVNTGGISKNFKIGDKVSFNLKGAGDVCVAC